MRKILIYLFSFILICFLIPVFFTNTFESKKVSVDQPEENTPNTQDSSVSTYDYKEYNTIRLLHKNTNEIEEIGLDDYLYGVVSAEMPAVFEKEALKAQAVVARTYTIYTIINNKGKHEGAQICDDSTCCQAWISKEDRFAKWEEGTKEQNWEKITNAVNETKGKIVTYEGQPINAFFHSNSGGTTEIPINVWGGSGYPYLAVVQTARRRCIFSI